MVFSEPKVEFVRIDMKMAIACSDCDDNATQDVASGEDCINSGAPSNNCPNKFTDWF